MDSVASSSSLLPSGEYEVFLSFRGPEIRNTFADHLYSSLARAKIRTFRDEEELCKGEDIAPSLVRAIPESKIYIPILTKHYASSKWCLQELAQMVECWKLGKGYLILPIFYFVDPGDVRHQQGSYEQAIEQHAQKHSPKAVKEWKEALQEVGQMKGWHVAESDSQGAVIEKVLSKVESHLKSMYTLVTDELVGIDTHVEQVMELLNLGSSNEKVIVGIHGMGGLGKTTLSKTVYNKIFAQFDRCCFLEDVREILIKSDGAISLQNTLISSILKKDDCQVKNVSQGIKMIKERVCKHKVLVVIDDIDGNFEFHKVLGKLGDFSVGSRFIFTTRDKRVLDFLPGCKLYEPAQMSDHHAIQLFSKHAFAMDHPPEDYATISEKFVTVAAGLPLALEVLGSLVFRRNREFWEEKLIELQEISSTKNKLQERLKVSYNELTHNEKQIFLDIACCFIGRDKELPWYMWSGCSFHPKSGIDNLILKSLIKLTKHNRLWMHDHLRDLGRAIVIEEDIRNPYKRSRIWSTVDGLDMLRNGEGNDRVEVVRINMDDNDDPLTNKEFEKLSGLRYLEISCGGLAGDFSQNLPNLSCLILRKSKSVPDDLNMRKLAVLGIYDCPVEDSWRVLNSRVQTAKKLKVLQLCFCPKLTRAPDLSHCESLELINLTECSEMTGGLHIGYLKNLKKLKLQGTRITELTGEVGMLQRLQEIDANETDLIQLPVGMDKLFSLEILSLQSLESDNLNMIQVPRLPTGLKRLSLSSSRGVPNLVELKELEYLQFKSLQSPRIPGDIWKLPNLKELIVQYSRWDSLLLETTSSTSAAALPLSLTRLELRNCRDMERLPSLANLGNLTILKLSGVALRNIRGLGELRALEKMVISTAPNLRNLNGLENLLQLTSLVVESCDALERLPSLANLIKLETLTIGRCPILVEIKGLGDLSETLSHLDITHCPSLSSPIVEVVNQLERMQRLVLINCGKRWSNVLPRSLSKFRGGLMKELSYGEEPGNDVDDIAHSEEEDEGKYMKRFPDVSVLTNLKQLHIYGCRQLTEVTGLETLVSLESLTVVHCTSITMLPELSRNLEELVVSDCGSLIDAVGIERSESLRKLKISDCGLMKELPNLSRLKSLEELEIRGCVELTGVKGVDRLESLQKLVIRDCGSLQELGDVSGLKNLREFDIEGCPQPPLSEVKPAVGDVKMGKRMKAKRLVKSAARYGQGIAARFVAGFSGAAADADGTTSSSS